MKKYVILVLVLWFSKGQAQDVNIFFKKADVFFKTNVANGRVAYSKIHLNQEPLNELLKMAKSIRVTKEDATIYQAFWVNAYNVSVIKGIMDNYPTKSPLDHIGFFDKTTYSLGGKQITLNTIENALLRAQFNDARFHFVLVCGAIGCPPLINKAYFPGTINAQLDTQTRIALNGTFLKVNTQDKQIKVSQIMEWYKNDFTSDGASEIDFINTYRTEKIPNDFELDYFPYNWKLNTQ